MKLKQTFIKNKYKKNIFTSVLIPSIQKENNDYAILICPPIFQERMWSQRVCNNFLRYVAQKGYYGAYLHYYGFGDSDGESDELTIQTMVDDILLLCKHLREDYNIGKIYLCGLRMGAIISILASQKTSIDKVVLWSPVLDIDEYLYDQLKMCLSTQTTMFREIRMNRKKILEELYEGKEPESEGYCLNNIYGYKVSKELFEQSKNVGKIDKTISNINSVSIVDINPMGRIGKQLSTFVSNIKNNYGKELEIDVIKEKRFWINERHYRSMPEELFEKTINLFEN